MEVRNLTADEIAFVQVKSESDQAELNRYVERFEAQSDRYARMIFAVHTSEGLTAPADDPRIQVWTGERIAPLVVGLGLGEWVETNASRNLELLCSCCQCHKGKGNSAVIRSFSQNPRVVNVVNGATK